MWGFRSFKPLGEVGSIKMKVFTYVGYMKFFVQSSTPSLSMPPRLTEQGDFCMQNNQLETKTQVELIDNSNILSGFLKALSYTRFNVFLWTKKKRKKQVQWCERLSLDAWCVALITAIFMAMAWVETYLRNYHNLNTLHICEHSLQSSCDST